MKLRAATLLLAFAGAGVPAAGQTGEHYSEEQRVTAVDLLIDLEADKAGSDKPRQLPKDLSIGDLTVRAGGVEQPIVALWDPRALEEGVGGEPWHITLYFDLGSAAELTVHWAAGALATHAPELTALGEVEIVLVDDEPFRYLAPTRDPTLLAETLSGLFLRPRGRSRLLELRGEFLQRRDELAPDDLRLFAVAEAQEVEHRLDLLVTYASTVQTSASQRALFWVSDGFDLQPLAFYQPETVGERDPRLPVLDERTDEIASTLAAYRWLTLGVHAPEAEALLVPGKRIGKWRIDGPAPLEIGPGLSMTREADRDPEKAEAYLQIGESHLTADRPEKAVEALETALIHFARDPRTATLQGRTYAALGRALTQLGEEEAARRAFVDAVSLDPALAAQYPLGGAKFSEPEAPAERMAATTSGRLVVDEDSLAAAVESLSNRLRLTYQIADQPLGELVPIEAEILNRPFELRYPRWARSGTASVVSEARARRLLWGDVLEGPLAFRVEPAEAVETQANEAIRIELEAGTAATSGSPRRLRMTYAIGDPDGGVRLSHQNATIDGGRSDADPLELHAELPPRAAEEVAVLVLEDLESGAWGAWWFEAAGHQAMP